MVGFLKRWWRRAMGVAGSFEAKLIETGSGLRTEQFTGPRTTPGNVAVCLSGGGSRALTAGMGQLRALQYLKTADGKNLLGQARMVSTVSGGSWLGVPFEYLSGDTTDDGYLNQYVPDPGCLVPSKTEGRSTAETLDELPDGNIGDPISSRLFGPGLLTVQVLLLHKFADVPTDMLWQTVVALHILRPYGLYEPGRHYVPSTFFSYDEATEKAIFEANSNLDDQDVHLIASGSGRTPRPFLVCNTSMFVSEPGTSFKFLAPVQATPFYTGIVGKPTGTDANGRVPGGGGVTSFAFSSNPTEVAGKDVTIDQSRQLALMDIVGASSAFFAEALENLLSGFRDDVDSLFDTIMGDLDNLHGFIDRHMEDDRQSRAHRFLDKDKLRSMKKGSKEHKGFLEELASSIGDIKDLIPEYDYWPVAGAQAYPDTEPTRFADGGNLENTGVASALAFGDIDNVISFVNSSSPMTAGAKGVIGADGKEIPGTRVVVASQVPPLFGYQPYDAEKGYVLYTGDDDPQSPIYKHNQVFPSEAFAELLKGWWKVSGNSEPPESLGATGDETPQGVNDNPVVLEQTLKVLDNPWFGVSSRNGKREVGVLWLYNNRVRTWYNALSPEVQEILGDFDDPSSFHSFPHYSTIRTHLTATELNLLASLNAWCVGNPGNAPAYVGMFS